MNPSQTINLHFCTILSQNAQCQDLLLPFTSAGVACVALDNPKNQNADESPSKGHFLQAGDRIHAEELLMTVQKLGWEVKGKR